MDSDALAHLDRTHVWHPFTQQRGWEAERPVLIERGVGCTLYDTDGTAYLDGVSSLWCTVHGHRHPRIDAAIREQLDRVAHSTMLGLSHPGAAELAARLVEIAPPGLSRDLFHERFRSLLFPTHQAEPGDAADMRRLLEEHGERIAAVIMEPLVQGAAGMIVHPDGYLRAVRELCDEFRVLLICDEVAVGFGRTGTMFACQQEDVAPDLMCVAKGITGGYLPLAATLTTEEVYESFLGEHAELRTFFHGHTYTGNPLACAAALATLDVFEEERTLERLAPKIALLGELLEELVQDLPTVAEIRRRGFMTGIELIAFPLDARMGHRVTLAARRRGAIVRPLGDTIVLMPPLSITEDELVRLVGITAGAIEEATGAGLRLAA